MAGVSTTQSDVTSPKLEGATQPEYSVKPVSGDASSPADTVAVTSDQPQSSEQRKDRKPRRERLPLPEIIPEAPVKRYPEPSKSDLQTRIEEKDKELQACFDKLNSSRQFFDERQKIREAGKPKFEAARKIFVDLNEKCRTLFEERKLITNALKALKEADIAARSASNSSGYDIPGAGKDGNDAIKGVRTIEELESRIEEFNYRLETQSVSIAEEKRIVAQIAFLNHGGREFICSRDQSFKDEKVAKEVRITNRKELEEARKAKDQEIDNAKARLEDSKKKVDDIRAKQDADIKNLQDSTSQVDRDAEKKKIGEIKGVIKEMREEFQVELDKWYLNERIHYEQQKIAKRKKYEAMQSEREARRKAWEEDQAQYPEPHPYQEEKDMCAGLTVYLQALLGESSDKPSLNLVPGKAENAPSLKTTANTREISASGTAIGKLSTATGDGFENLAFSGFVKKSGKSKNKKGRGRSNVASGSVAGSAEDTPLKPHPIDYITAFTKLDVKPPNKMNEVRAALEAVKAKLAYYETAPAPSEEEKAKRVEGEAKKQISEKKSAGGVDLMNGDAGAAAFPGLQSEAAAPARAMNKSLPSFSAVASGVATAPQLPSGSIAEAGDVSEVLNGQTLMDGTLGGATLSESGGGNDAISSSQPELSLAEA